MKLALIVVTAVLLATPAVAQTNPIGAFIEAVILSSKTHDGLQRKTPDRYPTADEAVSRSDKGKITSADPDRRIRTKLGREAGEQDAE